MNNMKKILLGLTCLSFSTAYAFTPSQSTCETYVNSMAPLNGDYFMNNQANIEACLSACPSIYGNGSDSATLKNISRCTKNLKTLSFIGRNYLQNPQYANDNASNQMSLAVPVNSSALQIQAPQPLPQAAPAAPIVPAPAQNNSAKSNQQIKWF